MRHNSHYIAIEGPIGVGKTSLAKRIGEYYRTEPVFEAVDENPFLEKFYSDPQRYAFQVQMFFLMNRYTTLSRLKQLNMFEHVTVCDYVFEKDRIFAHLNLDETEFGIYNEIYELLKRHVPRPDLVLYLQADTDIVLDRIRSRGRKFERDIPEEYIAEVNSALNSYFFGYSGGPLLIVNTDSVDFVNNDADFHNLIRKIQQGVKGTEYFNPRGPA